MKSFKYWMEKDAASGALHYFAQCLAAPVLALSTFKVLTEDIYAVAELISILMGSFLLYLVGKGETKSMMVRHGGKMILADYAFWIGLAVLSYRHIELRYISMVVLMPMFYSTKSIMFKVVINRNMKGDELTDITMWAEKFRMLAGALGFFAAFLMAKMDINIGLGSALLITQLGAGPSVYTDYQLWKSGKDTPAD